MRLDVLRRIFLKEVRETLRDRRSLAVMFGIPLLLYPLLTLATAGLATSTHRRMSRETTRVAILRPQAAPHLLARLKHAGSGVEILRPRNPSRALAENEIDAVLVLPPRCEADALAARKVQIRVQLDRSRTSSEYASERLKKHLEAYEQWILTRRLQARGVPASLMRRLELTKENVASGEQRLGSILAMVLPTMLLFSGMLGAFYPAVNATTTERERGTLETLLVTPATKAEILVAKGTLVLLTGLLTAGLNMLSMALVIWRFVSMVPRGVVSAAIDPGALALAYLAAVPTILFLAAAVLIVGLLARNYQEASAYATGAMCLPLVPQLVAIAEPAVTPGLLATPVVNTALIIREVLTGHATAGPFLLAFASSCLYAALLLSLAARLFTTENLVNQSWEPLSLRGLRVAGRGRPRRLPATDEALALFAVSLLLFLYVSPAWMNGGLLAAVAGNELLLIAAPAVLFAWLWRYRWVETFSWRRPRPAHLLGAALLGIGLVPWMDLVLSFQSRWWPPDPEFIRTMERMFLPALHRHPYLAPLLVGAMAGICEELLFRGPIQTALGRRLPAWFAVGVAALLFAGIHLRLYDLWALTAIGCLLGWVVLRTGSIFPAMLLHGVYDTTKLALAAQVLHASELRGYHELAARMQAAFTHPLILALGALLFLIGWRLCLKPAKESPAPPG